MPKTNGKRKYFSPEEKVQILRKHLLEKIPVSDLCDQYQLNPTIFYRWQKQFFEQGSSVFTTSTRTPSSSHEQKIAQLESKLARKNEVLSELMEEHVRLKKEIGEI